MPECGIVGDLVDSCAFHERESVSLASTYFLDFTSCKTHWTSSLFIMSVEENVICKELGGESSAVWEVINV